MKGGGGGVINHQTVELFLEHICPEISETDSSSNTWCGGLALAKSQMLTHTLAHSPLWWDGDSIEGRWEDFSIKIMTLNRGSKAACTSEVKREIHAILPIGMKMFSPFLESRDSAHLTWRHMSQNIPLVNLGQLCPLPTPLVHPQPTHWTWTGREGQSGKQRKSLDAVQALFSSSQSFGVLSRLLRPQIQSTEPYGLQGRKLTPSQTETVHLEKVC